MDARFQVCFTPLAGVLFAFPSRYWFAIGHHVVFRLGGWSPRIRAGFHVSRPTWDPGRPRAGFRLRGFHPLWRSFPAASPNLARATARSRNPGMQASRFGLVRFRSPLLTQSRLLSFPRGTEMFHFPRCRPPRLFDSARGRRDRPAGLPHSETHGSRAACASPWNIAACRVLRRHPLPRHPSCARKACPQKSFPAAAPPDFLDAPAGSRAPSGRGLPLLHSMLPSKSFYLSLPVVKEPPEGTPPGNQAAQYETSIGLARSIPGFPYKRR